MQFGVMFMVTQDAPGMRGDRVPEAGRINLLLMAHCQAATPRQADSQVNGTHHLLPQILSPMAP